MYVSTFDTARKSRFFDQLDLLKRQLPKRISVLHEGITNTISFNELLLVEEEFKFDNENDYMLGMNDHFAVFHDHDSSLTFAFVL